MIVADGLRLPALRLANGAASPVGGRLNTKFVSIFS
jgi:hypothetical protein